MQNAGAPESRAWSKGVAFLPPAEVVRAARGIVGQSACALGVALCPFSAGQRHGTTVVVLLTLQNGFVGA